MEVEFRLESDGPEVFILNVDRDPQDSVRIRLTSEGENRMPGVLLESVAQDQGWLVRPSVALLEDNMYEISVTWDGKLYTRMWGVKKEPGRPNVKAVVYPLSEQIPENTLQFHIQFSQSMVQNPRAYELFQVLDSSRKPLQTLWRQKSEWNQDGTHLALMIHPGRVKRGIEYLGDSLALFRPGESYTLVLVDTIRAEIGQAMTPQRLKQFRVKEFDSKVPQLLSYGAAQDSGYFVSFNEAMDYGTMCYGVSMYDKDNNRLKFTCTTANDSTWEIQLDYPKNVEPSILKLEDYVSDVCANRMSRTFEVRNSDAIREDSSVRLYLDPGINTAR
ncbi:MAG: hypothetical protein JJ975_13555 [Bacteroidia bacterium]|nr:hypothetical protein [Bacteroidia bacterium]